MCMATTRSQIRVWLEELYADDHYTHMVVACDTFDYSDYPIYICSHQNVREELENHKGDFFQVMEVYSKNYTKESQLAEHRAFHYD